MENLWLILFLGLLLGVRHAMDADHLVAVSTIVSEYKNPLRAIWIGVSWGLGHTTTLFLAGIALLFLKISLPERLIMTFEFLVGIMLVFLGIQIFWNFRKKRVHLHPHETMQGSHQHFHSHQEEENHGHHRLRLDNLASFFLAGILYIVSLLMNPKLEWYMLLWILQIAGPAFLVGILFLIGWKQKRKRKRLPFWSIIFP